VIAGCGTQGYPFGLQRIADLTAAKTVKGTAK